MQTFALEANRPNVVARLTGNGRKRPLLIMAHTDTVNVDPAKWQHPPFSAARDGAHIYGRGTVDDKDSVTAGLMTMLLLKRNLVPLDRDVIFLAEAGEEGTREIGVQFMIEKHYDAIDAEYCLAEGGSATRVEGDVRYVGVQTAEKFPKGMDLIAHGVAGHGSVPLETNPIARLARAITAVTQWQPPVVLNDTTARTSRGWREIEEPPRAPLSRRAERRSRGRRGRRRLAARQRSRAKPRCCGRRSRRTSCRAATATTSFRPRRARRSMCACGPARMPRRSARLERLIGDSEVEVVFNGFGERPAGLVSPIDGEAFVAISRAIETHYAAPVLPMMSTGATDMAFLRAKGIRCYGVGPAVDQEDGPLGFGAHSDQERIVEAELYRFVRFHYDAVVRLAGAARP